MNYLTTSLLIFIIDQGGSPGLALPVQRASLQNGMPLLLHEDHSSPIVTFQVFYRCGSRNETPGITGISHLLEHMMFNGSERYPPKAFDRLLEAAGGASNGYTTRDYTTYMESFPPSALPLVIDLESDRLRSLAITHENLEQERGIVMEERRWAVDNDNEGAIAELAEATLFLASPYRVPVIGWMGDIERIRQEDVQAWFDRCYAPANALIVVGGDIRPDKLVPELDKAFGTLPTGRPMSPPAWVEPAQEGLRYVELHRVASQTHLRVGYRGPSARDADMAGMELLDHILTNGRASLLVDRLVYQEGLFDELSSSLEPLEQSSMFFIDGILAEGVDPTQAADAIEALIDELRASPPSPDRVERARRQAEMMLYARMETVEGKVDLLGSWEILGPSAQAIAERPATWTQLSAEELRSVAARWLAPESRTLVVLQPLPESDPEPESLSSPQEPAPTEPAEHGEGDRK